MPPSTDDTMSSLLVAALPASIQSRIPQLPSLRRPTSLRAVLIGPTSSTSTSTSTVPSSTATSSATSTQPSSGSSSPSSSRPSTSYAESVSVSSRDLHDFGLVVASKTRPVPSNNSSVNWKYGQNGYRTLEQAMREAGDPDCLPALERQIYVESVAYLLRGLPSDLHEGELHQLRHAAPGQLLESSENRMPSSQLSIDHHQQQQQLRKPAKRSIPHVATHWFVTRLYALVLVLLPVVAAVGRYLVELNRRHRLPEAVCSWLAAVCLVLYRYVGELFVTVCDLDDGRVGKVLDEGTVYLANGVVSGFREAVFDVSQGRI